MVCRVFFPYITAFSDDSYKMKLEELKTRMAFLKTSKVYFCMGQSWQLVSDAEQAISQLSLLISQQIQLCQKDMNESAQMMASVNKSATGFIEHNSETTKKIIDILDEV